MESLNAVFLSGVLSRDAEEHDDGLCEFTVKTFKAFRNAEGNKEKSSVEHLVQFRAGTLLKYLKRGKSVIIQGYLDAAIPGMGYVRATAVTFPVIKEN